MKENASMTTEPITIREVSPEDLEPLVEALMTIPEITRWIAMRILLKIDGQGIMMFKEIPPIELDEPIKASQVVENTPL